MASWKMPWVTLLWVTMMKAPSMWMITMPWVSSISFHCTASVMSIIILIQLLFAADEMVGEETVERHMKTEGANEAKKEKKSKKEKKKKSKKRKIRQLGMEPPEEDEASGSSLSEGDQGVEADARLLKEDEKKKDKKKKDKKKKEKKDK